MNSKGRSVVRGLRLSSIRKMIKRVDLKYTAVALAIAAILGALISWFSSLPFWGVERRSLHFHILRAKWKLFYDFP